MDAKETVGFKESERSATLELHKVRLTVATELIIITIEVRTMEKDVRFVRLFTEIEYFYEIRFFNIYVLAKRKDLKTSATSRYNLTGNLFLNNAAFEG